MADLLKFMREGRAAFSEELQRRLAAGEDALDLSIETWKTKEKMLKDGDTRITLGSDVCPLCLACNSCCPSCKYRQFYGQDCFEYNTAYYLVRESRRYARPEVLLSLVKDMTLELVVMQEELDSRKGK